MDGSIVKEDLDKELNFPDNRALEEPIGSERERDAIAKILPRYHLSLVYISSSSTRLSGAAQAVQLRRRPLGYSDAS